MTSDESEAPSLFFFHVDTFSFFHLRVFGYFCRCQSLQDGYSERGTLKSSPGESLATAELFLLFYNREPFRDSNYPAVLWVILKCTIRSNTQTHTHTTQFLYVLKLHVTTKQKSARQLLWRETFPRYQFKHIAKKNGSALAVDFSPES